MFMSNIILHSFDQAFFPYLNDSGYGYQGRFDMFSQTQDGVAKKKLIKNELLDNYVQSYEEKVSL